ncbi:hypothetical protein NDU88_000764 [Pleurodeles waltl]|uniref:Uncharacterized protein n=1 Tax=Pleurodeles waltl TaxID=8319 RepID=A0AAV7Q502_PLEWA|nr:hypothetical protein NDU88_000764 [Pleurodeles waltl]
MQLLLQIVISEDDHSGAAGPAASADEWRTGRYIPGNTNHEKALKEILDLQNVPYSHAPGIQEHEKRTEDRAARDVPYRSMRKEQKTERQKVSVLFWG